MNDALSHDSAAAITEASAAGRTVRAPQAVWRGVASPLGATWDGSGVNFALYSEHAERVELCLFDPSGRREIARIDVPYRTDFVWHCYLPEGFPGLRYGYRVHGPYAPEQGHRFNPHKLVLDPYARMIDGPFRWSDAHFGYRVGSRREDLTPDTRDNAAGMYKARVDRSRLHVGRRPSAAHAVEGHRDLRGARQGHDAPASRRAAPAARHLRGPRHPARDRPPEAPRRDGGRAPAGPHLPRRQAPGRDGPAQLLGLQHARLLRARHALRGERFALRVQDDGQAAARGRARGDPRRRLQPHRRGQSPRAHAVVPRHRQRGVLPAAEGRPALLLRLHRHRQHAVHAASHDAAPHLRQPALLGHRHARRRLPLRPRLHTRTRGACLRSQRRLPRHRAAGSDPLAGEAHLRAVGPGRRRLPGGRLSSGMVRLERPLSRHRALVLEG